MVSSGTSSTSSPRSPRRRWSLVSHGSTGPLIESGAELFVGALSSYGVTHVFGNPGTTELPVVHAIPDSDLGCVLRLHEDIAVGTAGGYAST